MLWVLLICTNDFASVFSLIANTGTAGVSATNTMGVDYDAVGDVAAGDVALCAVVFMLPCA